MILRRLATSIRKQDWFAVVIETLIVVLGVFLGLQVNNWNEARQSSLREAEVLSALQAEFEQNIGTLNSALDRLNERNASEYEAALLLEAESLAPEDGERIVSGLREIMYFSPLSVRDNAFESLRQSGELSTISDDEILMRLNDFARRLAWIQDQRESFRTGISGMELDWRDYVFHGPAETPVRTVVNVDLEGFLADPRAVSAFNQAVRMKHIYASYLPGLIEDAGQTCIMLGEATGRPCAVEGEISE